MSVRAESAEKGPRVISATSLSQHDVQAAISQAESGDVVLLPEGSITWTKEKDKTPIITITKGITLLGAGTGKTIIQGTSETDIRVKMIDPQAFRISGVEFKEADITIDSEVSGFRIDHCIFRNQVAAYAIYTSQYCTGVIDHCTFTDAKIVLLFRNGVESWKRPLHLGTADAIYVEDCILERNSAGNVIDTNHGGKYVFRNNTVINGYVEAHSLQNVYNDGTFSRGSRSYEIYNNNFYSRKSDKSVRNWAAIHVRSGTGVIYNNTVTNDSDDAYNVLVAIDNRRSYMSFKAPLTMADGTNPLDGNLEDNGYPALDQIGRSTDASESEYQPQLLEPLYAWNNVMDGKNRSVNVVNTEVEGSNVGLHLRENRDYYNTERLDYEPYCYPHPLVNDQVLVLNSIGGYESSSTAGRVPVGGIVEITWDKPDADLITGEVNIELYKNDEMVMNIGREQCVRGYYQWKVPESLELSKDYFIRIYQGAISDESAMFSIVPRGGTLTPDDTAYPYDINGDGYVNIIDLAFVAKNIDKSSEDEDWQQVSHCDVNTDGLIDILDLSTVASYAEAY